MKRKTKHLIIAVLAIALVLFSTLYIYVEINSPETCPPMFTVGFNTQKVNGEYHLRCVWTPDESEYNLKLINVEVRLDNTSGILIHSSLSDLVDNESSEVIFYDNDSDGRSSVGDLFIIRGVEPMAEFTIAPHGRGGCTEILY